MHYLSHYEASYQIITINNIKYIFELKLFYEKIKRPVQYECQCNIYIYIVTYFHHLIGVILNSVHMNSYLNYLKVWTFNTLGKKIVLNNTKTTISCKTGNIWEFLNKKIMKINNNIKR